MHEKEQINGLDCRDLRPSTLLAGLVSQAVTRVSLGGKSLGDKDQACCAAAMLLWSTASLRRLDLGYEQCRFRLSLMTRC